jgi:hypothetical protein
LIKINPLLPRERELIFLSENDVLMDPEKVHQQAESKQAPSTPKDTPIVVI